MRMGSPPQESRRCFESTVSVLARLVHRPTWASRLCPTEIRAVIASRCPSRMVCSTLFHTAVMLLKRFSPQTHFVDKPREFCFQTIIPMKV